MWHRIVILYLLVFCQHTSPQPISDDPNNTRQARQLDLGECCPCLGSSKGYGSPHEPVKDTLVQASGMDDCPCRLRGADSEGAPSIFFPSAVRTDRPFMRTNNLKEEQKNLLEPEVGLASSVLETLREATEEEYQDALARDAAKMAADLDDSLSKDAMPEESARSVVTIILNPELTSDKHDDFISEASHLQESRCIHPLGSSSLGKMRLSASKPSNLFNDILRLPKTRPQGILHRNLLDMDSFVGASNVEERLVDRNEGIQRYKAHSPLLKLDTPKNNIFKSSGDDYNRDKVPNFTPASILDKFNEPLQRRSSLLESFSIPLIPRSKIDGHPESENNNNGLTTRPINLKNLLKLRDVELIPPKTAANKATDLGQLNTPKLDLLPFGNRDNFVTKNFNNREHELRAAKPITDLKYAPKGTITSNKKSDLMTSPSNTDFRETQKNRNECESKDLESKQSTEELTIQGVKLENTEVLDTVPGPSEIDTSVTPVIYNSNSGESNAIQPKENSMEENNTCGSSTQSNDNIEALDTIGQTESDENIQDDNSNEIIFILVDDELPGADDKEVDTVQIDQLSTESKENVGDIHDCLENTMRNDDQDPADTDNNGVSVFPQGQIESSYMNHMKLENDDVDEEELDTQEKPITNFRNTEDEIQENPPSHIMAADNSKNNSFSQPTNTVSFIKENVLKQMGNYKKPSNVIKQDTTSSNEGHNSVEEEEEHSTSDKEASDLECLNELSVQTTTTPTPFSTNNNTEDGVESSDSVSFLDLQTLSDSLLHKSTDKEETAKCDFNNFENGFDVSSDDTENITSPKVNLSTSNVKEEEIVNVRNGEDFEDTLFPNNSDKKDSTVTKQGEDNIPNLKSNLLTKEMTAEASDPFINTISGGFLNPFKGNNLRSSLQDIIVQPSSLATGDFNLFGKPVGDIFNLNTRLPTLDDLRLRLTNIFNTNERSAEDTSTSAETDCTNDTPSTFDPTMSTDASTSSFLTKLPPLKRLEDINIDIFQVNPLTRPQSDWMTSPRLNLKSYRAKLPTPNNLDLKPVKLESTLGTKAGILGASITTGSNRPGSVGRTALSHKAPEILGNPFENLLSLNELKDSLKLNTKNVLTTPLRETNVFKDNLGFNQGISDFSENLRSHAESALKNIHQTMETTLKQANLKDFNILGNSNNPQDILKMVSNTRDHLNDTLIGLQYDLNDRLTSMHENLFDQSRLMTNSIPLIKETANRNSNTMQLSSPRQRTYTLKSSKPSHIQTIAGRGESQRKDPHATSQRNNLSKPHVKYTIDKLEIPTFKMPASGSALVPKSIEPPTLKSTPAKSSLLHVQKEPYFKKSIGNTGSTMSNQDKPVPNLARPSFKDMHRPTLRKNVYPFKDTKITISFSTTTARPITTEPAFKSRQMLTTTPGPKVGTLRTPRPFSDSGRDRANFLKIDDARGVPSEKNPLRISALARSPNNLKQSSEYSDNLPVLSQTTKYPLTRPPVFKQSSKTIDENKATVTKNPFTKTVVQPLIWPKITENSFLSKAREAVLARLSMDPIKSADDKVIKSSSNVDMQRSASEKSDIFLNESLKENVSYKCKMVCTRED